MTEFAKRSPSTDQQAVINDLDHNIILYASAGTGKTFTVARRVNQIIEAGKARPEEILCLSFTIKAAEEMKSDILQYSGSVGRQAIISTIHSFAYQILKKESTSHSETYCLPNQSKGCEFDTAILAGVDDDHFPNYNSKIHDAMEEEKRVFYVAISRAKKELVLTSITQKVNRGGTWPVKQSRFIDSIPVEFIETRTVR